MITWLRSATLAVLLLGGTAGVVSAQERESIDRIVAVVGVAPILFSQVEERFYTNQNSRAGRVPTEPEQQLAYRRALIDTLINEELLYQEAIKDTMIKVSDQEVAEAVDQNLAERRRLYRTQLEFDAEMKGIGFNSLDEYRRWLIEQQRKEFYRQRFSESLKQTGQLKDLTPTEKEVRAYYDRFAEAGAFGTRPASVSLRQIVIAPKPAAAEKARAKALVDSIIGELRNGADFATAARRFGMDVTKETGGDLGYFRRGQMVREFEEVAFNLKPGVVSNAVESPFGYHIIQVTRAQPTEVQARHILIIPQVDSTGAFAAKLRAEEIAAAIQKGASFDSLQRLYHDYAEERDVEGIPVDSLSPAYRAALVGVDSGMVTPVFALEVPGEPLRSKYGIAKVTARSAQGARSYDSIREGIRRFLATENGLRAYMAELRRRTYVDIRWP